MKRDSSIEKFLHPLASNPYQAYLTNEIQLADVLEWILNQVGKATVWQTSFSISEEFLRRLFFIQKSGKVDKFYLVLDHKATNKTIQLWNFITQVIDLSYLADNHSKILLVKADNGQMVTVITSQNLTRGNRAESAIVTTDANIFATLYAQVTDMIQYHSVPLNALYDQRIKS